MMKIGIVDENEMPWYDIVMPKKDLLERFFICDRCNVKVICINIAHDGRPGVFVEPDNYY
jgi:hypothetical protein